MVSHYLYEAEFCSPASGWEKGQIEKNVQDARHRIWQAAPAFDSLKASMHGSKAAASNCGGNCRIRSSLSLPI
jgi:hypothetical protein